MRPEHKPDAAGPRKDGEDVTISDLPSTKAEAEAANVKGGFGPVDGKINPKPYGPIDA